MIGRITLVALVAGTAGAQAPTVTKEFTIGCAECGDARQFASIQEVALLADGRVLVADRDAPMLRLFDGDGAPLWAKGRRGAGPGEYQYVIRVAPAPSGELLVADMSGRRLTTLSASGDVLGTVPLSVFVTTAGTDGRGALVLGGELPMGGLKLYRASGSALTPVTMPEEPGAGASATTGPAFRGASVAVSASGVIAIAPHSEQYRIVRVDASGAALPVITRAIERVRRTPEEEAALKERLSRGMAATRAALERETGKAPATTAPVAVGAGELSLKPHFAVDGLRYDGAGRLWVRTMRGDDRRTTFDVFAATGAYLGSVDIAGPVQQFAFNGPWMLTSGEDADGIPQVTRWRLGSP